MNVKSFFVPAYKEIMNFWSPLIFKQFTSRMSLYSDVDTEVRRSLHNILIHSAFLLYLINI